MKPIKHPRFYTILAVLLFGAGKPSIHSHSMVESFQIIPFKARIKQNRNLDSYIYCNHVKRTRSNYELNKVELLSPSPTSNISRRRVLNNLGNLFIASSTVIVKPFQALASDDRLSPSTDAVENTGNKNLLLKGTVTIQPGTIVETYESTNPTTTPALYITARPNKIDNVPKAILDGSRGKPPPVLIARYPLPPNEIELKFPFEFALTEQDLTVEGQSQWFVTTQEDLIVSARLDLDGVAATRDPGDLVGRGIYFGKNINNGGNEAGVKVQLQGRGITGKFVTKKAK